ncbi:hypothetical protein HU200_066163 [Digitaria exilis]|uniref:DUF4220 domain-containing protein n=1 Tax=Digitaria exilis TaxID=1010633 RepID=A0A835A2L3_9POAL|nr:hypothetical protein HU200_066163 [Digitaria exilis]
MEVQHLSVRNATVTAREWSASQVGLLVRVEVLVTLSCALLTALVFLGSSRRNSHSAAFRLVVWLVLMLSYPAVSYTIGLMQSGSFDNSLVVVWACFLLGCSDGIATCSVDGNDKQARIMLNQATQVLYVFLLLISYMHSLHLHLKILLVLLWVLNVVKLGMRLLSLLSVGRERVLTADNWLISKYMADEEQVSSAYGFDPKTMEGYKYVVTGEMKKNGRDADSVQGKLLDATDAYVVTVDKVWQCEGSLLSSKDSSSSKFKDLCLSFALFKLLRRRLNSSPLPELGDIRTAVFVRRGIAGGGDHERLFRVMEVELSFLYDFHYARYPSPKQTLIPETAMFVAQMALSLCTLFSSPLLHYSSNNNPAAGDNKTISTGLDIWLARLVIALFVILELFQYLSLVLSDWHKVKLLCRYVRRRSWHGHRAMEMLLWLVCRATLTTRYWSNTVGQYSLLHACLENERSWILRMPLLHEWVKGRLTEARRITRRSLPTSVKQAIHQHLKSDWLCYSAMYGDRTLQRNILEYDFEWFTSSYKHGGMGILLIWHIATTIRGAADAGGDAGGEDSYEAATTLSNYCGYLLFQAPELVTDAIYDERLLMEALHRRIQEHLRSNQCRSEGDMFVKLLAFKPSGTNTSEEDEILADGVRLGSLIEAKLPDEKERWKVLAEMWVELLLTVTPSHNVSAHVNRLATGGELITHLWPLLTHAGMIERPTPCTLWAPYVYRRR